MATEGGENDITMAPINGDMSDATVDSNNDDMDDGKIINIMLMYEFM